MAIILDYQAPDPESDSEDAIDNVMALWLAKISDESELSLIIQGFSLLLNSPLVAVWMPGSQKRVNLHEGTSVASTLESANTYRPKN